MNNAHSSRNGRLIVAFIAFPLSMVVVFLPWFGFFASKLVLYVSSIIAGMEIAGFYLRINEKALQTFTNAKAGVYRHILQVTALLGSILPPSLVLAYQYLPIKPFTPAVIISVVLIFLIITSLFSLQREYQIVYHVSSLFMYALGYPGAFIATTLLIAGFAAGPAHIFTVAFIVFSNDAMALVFGKLLGKERDPPLLMVSPTKTWAGFIAGFLAGCLAATISFFLFKTTYSPILGRFIITIILVNFAGIIGDLYVSVYKRMGNLKDTGNILPGKGGTLDTIDSLIFGSAVYYILMAGLFTPS